MEKRPEPSVTVVRTIPVAAFDTFTLAPETIAPLESLTTPVRLLCPVWA
jgi:hypothetical protein